MSKCHPVIGATTWYLGRLGNDYLGLFLSLADHLSRLRSLDLLRKALVKYTRFLTQYHRLKSFYSVVLALWSVSHTAKHPLKTSLIQPQLSVSQVGAFAQ